MRTLLALLIFFIFSPAIVMAKDCGVLELGDDSVWDYKNGSFFDIDGNKVASTVPTKKKLQFNIEGNIILIEKAVNKRTKKTTGVDFSIKLPSGPKIGTSKKGNKLLGVFQSSDLSDSFLLLNPSSGAVYKASIDEALISNKITFALEEAADFYVYDCDME